MPNPLEDLTGKNVIVDGVPLPDRKVIEFVAGDGVELAAADDSVNGQTTITVSFPGVVGDAFTGIFLSPAVTTATSAIDWTENQSQQITLSANTTFTFTAPTGPCGLTLKITQGASPWTTTWPASVKWAGGVAPVISTGSGAIDVIALYFDGTTYYGSFLQAFA